jgi:hypothetical protein
MVKTFYFYISCAGATILISSEQSHPKLARFEHQSDDFYHPDKETAWQKPTTLA